MLAPQCKHHFPLLTSSMHLNTCQVRRKSCSKFLFSFSEVAEKETKELFLLHFITIFSDLILFKHFSEKLFESMEI